MAAAELAGLLDSPEIGRLIEELEATRWTDRPGYPIRTMAGLCLVKSLYALPTWTKTVALVREHWALQRALGCEGSPPSVFAAYRFTEKLRAHGDKLERCIDGVIEGLRSKLPSYGRDLSIDASDMPAYANGQRYVSMRAHSFELWVSPALSECAAFPVSAVWLRFSMDRVEGILRPAYPRLSSRRRSAGLSSASGGMLCRP